MPGTDGDPAPAATGPAIEVILREVTDCKEAGRRTAEYAEWLAASRDGLQRFARVVSHDLQEPLGSIVSVSHLLERRYSGGLGEDADEFIGFIVVGGNRMQALITGLLAPSRVATTPAASGSVDAVAGLDRTVREAGAVVTRDPLPAVRGDATQIGQVSANLVGTAIQYRRPGAAPRVHVSSRRDGPIAEFPVADNGVGTEAEYHDRVFVLFQRLHARGEYERTGVGPRSPSGSSSATGGGSGSNRRRARARPSSSPCLPRRAGAPSPACAVINHLKVSGRTKPCTYTRESDP